MKMIMQLKITEIILIVTYLSQLTLTQPQQDPTYLQSQYLKDIQHLNDKLINYQVSKSPHLTISPSSNQSKPISNTVYFQPQTIWLSQNQLAEFEYENMQQGMIEVRIHQAMIDNNDIGMYSTAQQHYKMNQSRFGNQSSRQFAPCKLNDPEIQLRKLRTITSNLSPKQQVVTFLNNRNQYLIFRYDAFTNFELYKTQIDPFFQHYSRTQLFLVKNFEIQGIIQGNPVFFVDNHQQNIRVVSGKKVWRIVVEGEDIQVEQQGILGEGNEQKLQTQQHLNEEIRSVIPLKYGLLIQYQTYFQIYEQPLQNSASQRSQTHFKPCISVPYLKNLTQSQPIVSIVVSQQVSYQSGYKINVLLRNGLLIEFQYGAYSSINVFKITYGETFHKLAVREDVIEVVFSVTKSKKEYFYVMELKVNRKENPRNPQIYLNRFYNELKDLKKVEFLNDQLLFIGQRDILIYDSPVDSSILIRQNITQTPYIFASQNLQTFIDLQHFSTKDSACLLLVSDQQMSIAVLKRKPQSISCSSPKSFDSVIEMIRFCDQNRVEVCRYVGSLRGVIQDPEGERMNQVKRYLIMGLIVAVGVAVIVVVRQICKNRKTIERLSKIKESLDKKFSQLETKGKKVNQEDKFQDLQEEMPDNNQPIDKLSRSSTK